VFIEDDKRALERVRFLLDHWDAIFDGSPSSEEFVSVSSSFSSSPPGRLPDEASHFTIKELERCLRLLLSACPGDYRHLKAYRCGAEWRNVDTWRRVKLPSGKYDWVPDRVRERVVLKWVRPERVEAAERFIVRAFSGEIFLPDDLYKAFTGQPAA
jgi:hypothetical protein